ncbi:hypothetical protein H6F43_13890 [Leptolyngbya sp. FACHB-36]|uniref:hypothetical protein n=1 Tax=Leptolyngbya sp. FACHB-36 TaxID=2692808 RepID=UPI00168047E7|nr:hypothetical protein [Leptolyngbya sp. FACHB-36]MBD2021267.1 hypothetical protein [Leptolyngbya sp. FACHB-36]
MSTIKYTIYSVDSSAHGTSLKCDANKRDRTRAATQLFYGAITPCRICSTTLL